MGNCCSLLASFYAGLVLHHSSAMTAKCGALPCLSRKNHENLFQTEAEEASSVVECSDRGFQEMPKGQYCQGGPV